MSKEKDFSRRNFIKATGLAVGAAAFGGAVMACADTTAAPAAHAAATAGTDRAFRGRMFFVNDVMFNTLSQAAERIFPKDSSGPGAIELAAPYFIDNQLAGAYGYNAREYMAGPHFVGAPTQGYQTAMNNREIFELGLNGLNAHANAKFNKNFPDITDSQKDEVLKACQAGQIQLNGISSSYFFSQLMGAVMAGVYADPIYNGNKNMDGWRMKKYPGAQMTYFGIISSPKFENMEPISMGDH
jgi:gluconate 2-dehydrogenase gamma chain